jgi:hypothetical protein
MATMDNAEPQNLRRKLAFLVQHIPGGALLFAVFMLIVLGYFGWYYYGADHLDQALYSLRLENLSVTAQPEWIKTKVSDEVYRTNRLDRISLLDPRANASIAQAFETHNWVKSAIRVSKAVGGKVEVDLVYRRPLAMIYVEQTVPDASGSKTIAGYLPIDSEGTMLPTESDFGSEDVLKYFVVYAQDARPAGDVGMPYGDVRIMEALSLCEFLQKYRETYGLQVIEIHQDRLVSGPSPWSLKIFTRDKRREIVWGHAPRLENSSELPADEKLKRLLAWLDQPLPADTSEIQSIDLRNASPIASASSRLR